MVISLTPQKFELTLLKRKIVEVYEPASGARNCTAPATLPYVRKIYTILNKAEPVYVGMTNRPIRERLRTGLNAKGEHGYHGYAWRDLTKVKVWVWTFPDLEEKEVESIEAEIAYGIRNKTGDWPKYQTEIHFSQATPKNKKIAESIAKILLQS